MSIWTRGGFAVLCQVLAIGVLGCTSTHRSGPVMIEQLIDQRSEEIAFRPSIRLLSKVIRMDEVQSFVAEYPFERRAPAEHCSLQVALALSGCFLDSAQYEARRAALQQAG